VRVSLFTRIGPGDMRGQCIALAGLFQAVEQVQICARNGAPSDSDAVRTSLLSVLRIDAPDPISVFGSIADLRPGLETLLHHVDRQMNSLRLEQARYAANLMYLERRLNAAPAVIGRLAEELAEIGNAHPAVEHDDAWLPQRLAELYLTHISKLGPRIMVSGEPLHLKAEDNARRIRALLLAGLRSAVLWRQCGGTRFRLTFHRARLRREIAAFRSQALP
jgi:high frequency lysogenization protein